MTEQKKRGRPRLLEAAPSSAPASPAQAYALRVWNGQSVDLPLKERVARVLSALDGQGFDATGIVLPNKDTEKFL